MSRRLDRLYNQAVARAQLAEIQLKRRLRVVATGVRFSWRPEDVEAAWKADPECCRLLAVSETAWATVELRRQQLLRVRAVA